MKHLLFLFLALLFAGCSAPKYKNPHVVIESGFGDIELELYPNQAPKTVAAFLSAIDAGYYKDASFYRILNKDNQLTGAGSSELIQGGIWKTHHSTAMSLPRISHETTQQTGILHTDGTLSMARDAPGSAGSEFFICIGDQHGFDFGGENNPDGQGYAAFGRVFKGMDVVKIIYNQPEENQSFNPSVPIKNITRK